MVEIKTLVPNVIYDLRYATKENFTGNKLYKNGTTTFLRLAAAKAFQKVAENLAAQGLGIKIWDAYRPYAVTKQMWDLIRDERYVANPANGSGHNRGIAIDLTMFDLRTGMEMNMGTPFDNFTDSAHHTFKALPDLVLRNRALLKTTMEKFGFIPLETEWWHYSFPNDRSYAVLDLSSRKLAKHW
jgi:D-alanyl-D-alanine dipeptidase